MGDVDEKALLHRYLAAARNALLWKLDGLSEYDARRPLTPTGTNLLGLVKHAAGVELNYFGRVFDRPFPDPPRWSTADALPAGWWAGHRARLEEIAATADRVLPG
ncbi:DUF664 domain-containing protein [Lentzea sp. NPDC102401]|uniref:mycothiol transferase n=1 Tax=Lentzea sp. NPDC102401 TaxID=3364128 RepID=UPI003821C2C2